MVEEKPEHGKRHYDLCTAVDGTRLSIALRVIEDAGADPTLLQMGAELIRQGRELIILANDRVGDSRRNCCRMQDDGMCTCSLRHNHAGPCSTKRELPPEPEESNDG